MQLNKRFVAGAICPVCKQIDKITLQREAKFQLLECVSCGHSQKQIFEYKIEGN